MVVVDLDLGDDLLPVDALLVLESADEEVCGEASRLVVLGDVMLDLDDAPGASRLVVVGDVMLDLDDAPGASRLEVLGDVMLDLDDAPRGSIAPAQLTVLVLESADEDVCGDASRLRSGGLYQKRLITK